MCGLVLLCIFCLFLLNAFVSIESSNIRPAQLQGIVLANKDAAKSIPDCAPELFGTQEYKAWSDRVIVIQGRRFNRSERTLSYLFNDVLVRLGVRKYDYPKGYRFGALNDAYVLDADWTPINDPLMRRFAVVLFAESAAYYRVFDETIGLPYWSGSFVIEDLLHGMPVCAARDRNWPDEAKDLMPGSQGNTQKYIDNSACDATLESDNSITPCARYAFERAFMGFIDNEVRRATGNHLQVLGRTQIVDG